MLGYCSSDTAANDNGNHLRKLVAVPFEKTYRLVKAAVGRAKQLHSLRSKNWTDPLAIKPSANIFRSASVV
jgi:hypothetical protein